MRRWSGAAACGWRASRKRYGGVRALEEGRASTVTRAESMPCSAKTAPASRRSSRSWPASFAGRRRMSSRAARSRFADPAAANGAGIVCIFQELSLHPRLTVADNIVITNPPEALRHDRPAARSAESPRRRWRAPAPRTSIRVALVKDLPLSRRQMVEIAKALARNPKHPDPRRGDLGADRRRRGQGLRGAEEAARGGPRDRLHLAPHARDRRARRRMHSLPQRPQRRHLRGRHEDRRSQSSR